MRFWSAHEEARREIREAVIADAGHDEESAPRALQLAAESIAQATLIRDSAYTRIAEAGGPLASSGRVRRAFVAWERAVDRLERHLRLVGLRRTPKPAPSLADLIAQREAEARERARAEAEAEAQAVGRDSEGEAAESSGDT